ncbi:MAG: O-antigen ligase family protein [Kiritimatiellia bacterium]
MLVVAGCIAPWFFGTWEMWWFWPFSAVLAGGMVFGGASLFLRDGNFPARVLLSMGLCVPFLVYLLVRWWVSDAVFLDAERSVLLHITGVWVGVMSACFVRERHVSVLFGCLYVSLLCMAAYGIVNHVVAGSRLVLWAPRFEQYAGRATGPYFCPDHFAGAMELLICMGLGLLLDRASCGARRLFGISGIVLGFIGAVMTLSRGSGMTLAVICGLVVVFGFYQWPKPVRHAWRVVCCMLGLMLLLGGFLLAQNYRHRFVTYGGLDRVAASADEPVGAQIIEKLRRTSRGRMFAGAWRSWQTAPWFGVGPGMHRHMWPAFAASADGDRAAGVWPTLLNDDFHSYEVHNDWLELLQEHGLVGIGLFLLACAGVVSIYVRSFVRIGRDWSWHEFAYMDAPPAGYYLLLSGMLAMGAMMFHSLGDFNLQMPGTVWMLSVLVGLGLRVSVPLRAVPGEQ